MSLLDEIKRRNVFRVTAAYVIVGWLILQVSDIVLDFAGAPEWVGKMIIGLLIVGLIPAIALSWIFEVTPDGIQRDDGQNVASDASRVRRLDIVTIGAVILLGTMLLWQQLSPPDNTPGIAEPETANLPVVADTPVNPASIAVLPFADLSPAGDQEYFSDGIAEEILNALVRFDGLSVASRTSAFAFKGQDALGIPAIAKSLEVRHILEGSVRTAGQSIRITAQLIDANTDKHLWSETYDRVLSTENIFSIQDEIAHAIVTELAKSMPIDATAPVSISADTENLDAYQLFLRGREQFRARNAQNIPDTIEIFEQATRLDPMFARAWSGLAAVTAVAESWGHTDEDYRSQTQAAARRAIELDGNLALPYAALGNVMTNESPVDFLAAFDLFEKALERDPKEANAYLWRGLARLSVGEFAAASQDLEHCLDIDPAYENCRQFLATSTLYEGRTEQALRIFEESVVRGGTSQGYAMWPTYVLSGDNSSALHVLFWATTAFGQPFAIDPLYRSMTEADFDFDRERRNLEIAYEASTGEALDWSTINGYLNVALGNFDKVTPSKTASVWWHPAFTEFLASPHRKRVIREMGIYDYWLARGFPPQCRAVGDDDFECD